MNGAASVGSLLVLFVFSDFLVFLSCFHLVVSVSPKQPRKLMRTHLEVIALKAAEGIEV